MDFIDFNKHTDITNCNDLNNKKCEFVKGEKFHTDFYQENIVKNENLRFFQLSMYDHNNVHSVRSYLLKGSTANGVSMYDYSVLEQNEYELSKREFKKFKKMLEKNIGPNIKFKIYPVFTLEFISHPTGEEINVATSSLTNF
jgi:hypothetical protein